MLMTLLWSLAALVVLVIIVGIVLNVVGRRIPVEHQAISAIDVPADIATSYNVIEDIASFPTWAKGVTRVELLPDKPEPGGGSLQVAQMSMGMNGFILTRTVHRPPRTLERSIDDPRANFSGTWLYTLESRGSSTRIKLTETGRIPAPLPRAMMKYFLGYHIYIKAHMASLSKKLGGAGEVHKL